MRSLSTIIPHRVPFVLAGRFQQICGTALAEALADQEVSAPLRYHALSLVDDFPGIDQRHLASVMGIDRTNVGQIVDELEAQGLLERRVSGADRRARELHATARARELRRRLQPKMLAAQARILAVLTPGERLLLLNLLTRVIEANQALARPGAGRRKPEARSAAGSAAVAAAAAAAAAPAAT